MLWLDALLLPGALILLAALGPRALASLLERVGGTRGSRWVAGGGLAFGSGWLAFGALGPPFLEAPSTLAQLVVALLTTGAGLLATRRIARAARATDPTASVWPPTLVAATLAAAFAASALSIDLGTRVADDEVTTARAARRLRLRPWDANALLAAAWEARRTGKLDDADRTLERARRAGVAAAPSLELQAELYALRGRCDRARQAFDEALQAHAAAAVASGARLELGYTLPEALVLRCELRPVEPP